MLTIVSKLATFSSAALAHELRTAVTRVSRRLRGVNPAATVTLTQLAAMASIKTAEELTLGELAARERVQPPSMTRVVAALVEAGLVERKTDPNDGRQVLVRLTESGKSHLETEANAREAWLATELGKLSKDERETLREASEILLRLVED